MLAALLTAYRVGQEVEGAWKAAAARLESGAGPLAALRAFAAATGTSLDDATVAVLEDGLRRGLVALGVGIDAAAFVSQYADQIRAGADAVLDAVVEVGYAAGRVRHIVRAWSEE